MNAIDILNEQVPPSSMEQWATETAMAMAFDDMRRFTPLNGWTEVILESMRGNNRANNMKSWCNDNCIKRYQNWGRIFIFENKDDAILFKLSWS